FTHYTAARFHRLDIRSPSPMVWVTVPGGTGGGPVPGVRLCRSRSLQGHTISREGWKFTSVARTLVDMGTLLPHRRLEPVVYEVVQQQKVELVELAQAWASVANSPTQSS